MKEHAIWAVLHKSWEESRKSDRLLRNLVQHATANQLWNATDTELHQSFPEIPSEVWRCFLQRRSQTKLEKVESYLKKHNIHMVLLNESSYPATLKEIYQPPAILYWKGHLEFSGLQIAVVGSRKADHYGLSIAETLGRELSQAHVRVVSGLAMGIDAYSHKGALEGIAGTIAVQGCGIDRIYPACNRALSEHILTHDKSCILTEFPLGSAPLSWHFPQRNRIISGLSRGIVVVQAALKSGAFITVETALEQGKDVFAVPGQIENPLSAGPHRFLKEGAKLVTTVTDILEEYGQASLFSIVSSSSVQIEKSSIVSTVPLTKEQECVLQFITTEPIAIEELTFLCKLPIADLMSILSILELYGLVKQIIGRKYIRVN